MIYQGDQHLLWHFDFSTEHNSSQPHQSNMIINYIPSGQAKQGITQWSKLQDGISFKLQAPSLYTTVSAR